MWRETALAPGDEDWLSSHVQRLGDGVLPGEGNLKKELDRDKDFVALGSIH